MNRLILSLLTALTLTTCTLFAQAPQGINFQGIARDASGYPLALSPITVDIRIVDGGGTMLYAESHNPTTDQFGLFKAIIGEGTPSTGNFAAIDWAGGTHQLEVDIDGLPMATHDFESVPYALYAEKANLSVSDLTDVDLTGLLPGQTLRWNGTTWGPGSAGDSIWFQANTTAYYNQGRVGIGTDTPMATFHLMDVGGGPAFDTTNFLIGQSLTGSGNKVIWYGRKAAFRMGSLANPFGGYNYDRFWDYDSVGFYSFAGGQNSRAKGFGSFAWGSFGWADGSGSVAFFGYARGNNSYTFGGSSRGRGSFTVEGIAEDEGGIAMYGYTGGRYGVSIGGGTTGLGGSSSREDYAVAIGWNADARGQASIALGPSDAYGYNSFSTGWVTEARGNYSSTFGFQTNSYSYASMALGRYNVITGDSAAWNANDPVFMIGDGSSTSNRSNAFLIQKNGQTAIGYDSPVGMLQVSSILGSLNNNGALDATHAALLLGTTGNGMAFDANQIETIGNDLRLNFNSPENIYLVEGGGNVAIGHSAPAARLDVLDNGWQIRLDNAGPGGDDWYLGTSHGTWASGGGKFLISPNNGSGNAEFTIEGGGQVGIGTTNPSDRLQIDADAGEDALRVRVGGTTRLRVHDNGGVSVGANILPPPAGLLVIGQGTFGGDVIPSADDTYNLGAPTRRWDNVWASNGVIQTSDLRFKTDIQPLTDGLGAINRLRPVRFRWKNGKPEDMPKLGLIAQELQQVVPEVVHDPGEEKPLGVNYADLVPVLIQAIQEQQSQIEQQQQQLDALRQEVERLKAQSHE